MISLEQIRLLEGKISRAIELIRVLKDENATLRRGLDSAQKRMKELETLVDGLKADQKEIESVIVRTLRHLDDLEDGAGTAAAHAAPAAEEKSPPARPAPVPPQVPPQAAVSGGRPQAATGMAPEKRAAPLEGTEKRAAPLEGTEKRAALPEGTEKRAAPLEGTEKRAGVPSKDELDIF
jgi:FtsZ-binding cell division protein ZapB